MVPTVARQFKLLFLVIILLLSTMRGAPSILTGFAVQVCNAYLTRARLLLRWPRNVAQPEQ